MTEREQFQCSDGEGLPEELIEDFRQEINDHSEVIEEKLLAMEGSGGRDSLDAVFRAFHSIKGAASWVSLGKLVELCHQAEELLNDVRKRGGEMTSGRVDLLLEALDIIKTVRTDMKEPESVDSMVRKMADFRKNENIKKRSGLMRDDLTLWKRDEGDISVIMLEGDLGLKGTDKLVSEFVKLQDEGRYKLVVDIDRVTFICSSGLGALAVTLKNLREKGGDLKLVNPNGDVAEKLKITELDGQFDICSNVREAMGRF